jgi:hypothetical protein
MGSPQTTRRRRRRVPAGEQALVSRLTEQIPRSSIERWLERSRDPAEKRRGQEMIPRYDEEQAREMARYVDTAVFEATTEAAAERVRQRLDQMATSWHQRWGDDADRMLMDADTLAHNWVELLEEGRGSMQVSSPNLSELSEAEASSLFTGLLFARRQEPPQRAVRVAEAEQAPSPVRTTLYTITLSTPEGERSFNVQFDQQLGGGMASLGRGQRARVRAALAGEGDIRVLGITEGKNLVSRAEFRRLYATAFSEMMRRRDPDVIRIERA